VTGCATGGVTSGTTDASVAAGVVDVAAGVVPAGGMAAPAACISIFRWSLLGCQKLGQQDCLHPDAIISLFWVGLLFYLARY
jgi:hypothetical protein